MNAFVEDHPNYLDKEDYFTSSKSKAMRLAKDFYAWGLCSDPTSDSLLIWLFFLFDGFVAMFSLLRLPPSILKLFNGQGDC